MKKIRILNIIRTMNMGGAQILIMNLYRNIDREKIQFDFLLNEEGIFDDEIRKMGGKIYYTKYLTQIGQRKYKQNLIEFCLEHPEYKIVHSHMNQVSGIILEAVKQANIPVRIAHAHTNRNTNHLLGRIYKSYLQSKINKNATHLLACSEEAAQWMFKQKAKDAIIIENGIDIDKFMFSAESRKNIRKKYQIKDDTVVIGHVGRFSKVKNHIFLLEIFQEYYKKNQNSVLIMIGDGETKAQIKEKVEKMQFSQNVIFLESQKEIAKYYSAFDYFVFPSLFEGLGIVLIEAQTSGLKCFASDKVIPKEVKIVEDIKFLNLKENANVWAKEIPNDNLYERKLIHNEKYDIKKITKQLQDFYINICRK